MIDTETKKEIEINQQFEEALELLENTKKNIFITGNAGTGKSTLLDHFRSNTKKSIVVLAPTGVAALNIKGQTIHSFFGFRPDITVQKVKSLGQKNTKRKIYEKLQIIVIDEISMVRADLLDCIDQFMRLNGKHKDRPFGGVRMVFIGDLYQLPPVVTNNDREVMKISYKTPYFFSAHVFANFKMEFLELTKIYRQSNQSFIDLLNRVRNNTVSESDLVLLNSRMNQNCQVDYKSFSIYLTTTNLLADSINQEKLATLKEKPITMQGSVSGSFDLKSLPTAQDLTIKVGAQIMMLNNDSAGRWVNGSIGQVIKIREVEVETDIKDEKAKTTLVDVTLSDGKKIVVAPYTWEMYRYFFDEEKGGIDSTTAGSFTQYPMKLAWAVTIHKSQGKTFDHVILDIGNGTFAHGQIYVALSRCTTFEGLTLKRPVLKRHIFMDNQVVKYVENCRSMRDNGVVYEEDEYCDYSATSLF